MPRTAMASVGGMCYHVLNRGNGRDEVFRKADDYAELQSLRANIARGRPFGSESWQRRIAKKLGLELSLRPRSRPRKGVKK